MGWFFLLFAALAIFGALMLVVQKNPIVSALYLVVSFASLAGLFVLLHAPFLAAVQVIVYAGAIMVLFLFVIMLLNLRYDVDDGMAHVARRMFGWLLGIVLFALGWVILRRPTALGPTGTESPEAVAGAGNTQVLAERLFTDYLFPFELTSLVLLVAILGAVVLAMRRTARNEEEIEEAP
jgi:NADH-quinone oxidoreductase subunit J